MSEMAKQKYKEQKTHLSPIYESELSIILWKHVCVFLPAAGFGIAGMSFAIAVHSFSGNILQVKMIVMQE